MIRTVDEFYEGAQEYVDIFDTFSQKHALIGRAQADHICYKCGSKESFERTRNLFEFEGEYLFQCLVAGRRIAIIRLKRPIDTVLGPVYYLELSDQKPDGSQKDSFDHIEAYPRAISYEDMVAEFEKTERVTEVVRPHHTTHDIDIGGFLFRCTREPLIKTIRETELV